MLTEDMLGALFDALQGVKRFIFVGDPAQLPPIGAGRPFVDVVLAFGLMTTRESFLALRLAMPN